VKIREDQDIVEEPNLLSGKDNVFAIQEIQFEKLVCENFKLKTKCGRLNFANTAE